METHPVPQNVTSFEFHLIGDMTIKQFAYLAIGLTTAYLTYMFVFTTLPWIAVPVIVVSAGLGAAFAFIPIQDRPLDHWAGAFFRAVYHPTQRKWKISPTKKQAAVDEKILIQKRLELFISDMNKLMQPAPVVASIPAVPTTTAPVSAAPQPAVAAQAPTPTPAAAPIKRVQRPVLTENLFQKHQALQQAVPQINIPLVAPVTPASNYIPTDDKLQRTVELARQSQQIRTQIVQAEQQMEQLKQAAAHPNSQPGAYATQLQKVFDNLQTLIKNSQIISEQLEELQGHTAQPVAPTPTPTAPAKPKMKRMLPNLTSLPNVINGIVTDAEGNYLDTVVVVIHNQAGLPVRALKTNKLGQFTGSTPLPDGPYSISLEKDNLEFDVVKTELNGKVLPPMEISAKRGGAVTA